MAVKKKEAKKALRAGRLASILVRSSHIDSIARRFRWAYDVLGTGRTPEEWAGFLITVAAATFVVSFLLVLAFTFNFLYAVIMAPIAAFLVAYTITTLPVNSANQKIEQMERAMPLFISHLVATYVERRNMHDALLASTTVSYGPLTEEVVKAMQKFEISADTEEAFYRIRGFSNRYITRTFEIIALSLDTGVDVSESLNMLTSNIQQQMEARDEKNSRTGLSTWMIFASSAFFFPLFAGVGLTILNVLEQLLGSRLYSEVDKNFLLFILGSYLFVAVVMDSVYIGQVRYNSVKRGLLRFFPLMIGVAIAVFFLSMKLLGSFIGG